MYGAGRLSQVKYWSNFDFTAFHNLTVWCIIEMAESIVQNNQDKWGLIFVMFIR